MSSGGYTSAKYTISIYLKHKIYNFDLCHLESVSFSLSTVPVRLSDFHLQGQTETSTVHHNSTVHLVVPASFCFIAIRKKCITMTSVRGQQHITV